MLTHGSGPAANFCIGYHMQDLHPCCSGSGCLHRWRPSGCPAQRRATRRSRGGTEICRALVCPTAVRSGCQCFGLRARLSSFLRIHREVPRPSPCTCWSAPSSVSRAAKATASSSGLQLLWCFKKQSRSICAVLARRDGEYGVARTSVLELQGQAPYQVGSAWPDLPQSLERCI